MKNHSSSHDPLSHLLCYHSQKPHLTIRKRTKPTILFTRNGVCALSPSKIFGLLKYSWWWGPSQRLCAPFIGDNDVHVCVDMRRPNDAIVRERHVIHTINDILYELNGSTVFSKLDLKWGFHQVELDETSRYITNSSCHRGIFRYKRLNLVGWKESYSSGASSAASAER